MEEKGSTPDGVGCQAAQIVVTVAVPDSRRTVSLAACEAVFAVATGGVKVSEANSVASSIDGTSFGKHCGWLWVKDAVAIQECNNSRLEVFNIGCGRDDCAHAFMAEYLITMAIMFVSAAEATMGDFDEHLISGQRCMVDVRSDNIAGFRSAKDGKVDAAIF